MNILLTAVSMLPRPDDAPFNTDYPLVDKYIDVQYSKKHFHFFYISFSNVIQLFALIAFREALYYSV